MSIDPENNHSQLVSTLATGLSILGQSEPIISGVVLAVKAGVWVVEMVQRLYPVLEQKYAGTSVGAQTNAANNILDASSRVVNRIREYAADGKLTREVLSESTNDPAFATFFKDGLSEASETDSELSHEQFASLVAERMIKARGSSEAIKLRMARERLRDLNDRHLRLIGAIFVAHHVFIDDFDPSDSIDSDFRRYEALCEKEIRPHWDVNIVQQDYDHLDAANVLEIRDRRVGMRFGGERVSLMLNKLGTHFMEPSMRLGSPIFTRLNYWMQGGAERGAIGFKDVELKVPGWIIGASIHSQLKGDPLNLGQWE